MNMSKRLCRKLPITRILARLLRPAVEVAVDDLLRERFGGSTVYIPRSPAVSAPTSSQARSSTPYMRRT